MKVDTVTTQRAGELKTLLVGFAQQEPYFEAFRDFVADGLAELDVEDRVLSDDDMIGLFDRFILGHRLVDGDSLLERFVASRSDLSDDDRDLVLGWSEVVEQVFEVTGRAGDALTAIGLIDELPYRIGSTMGPRVFRPVRRGSYLEARLVPIGDAWLVSGNMRFFTRKQAPIAGQVALGMATRNPRTAFRNPEKLAQAWENLRLERAWFIEHFGADLVVIAGADLQRRTDEFYHYRHQAALARLEDGGVGPGGGRKREPLTMELPAELTGEGAVAVIHDEVDGLGFYARFDLVDAVFADPGRLGDPEVREAVESYLDDDSIEPMVLERLAARHPDTVDEVFRRLLERPGFRWDDDGGPLLRERKAAYHSSEVLPRIAPIGTRLAALLT